MVERFLGKKEVGSPILPSGSRIGQGKGSGKRKFSRGGNYSKPWVVRERVDTSDVRFSPPAHNKCDIYEVLLVNLRFKPFSFILPELTIRCFLYIT